MKEDTDKTWMEVHGGFAKDKTLRDEFAARAMPMLAAEFYSHKQVLQGGTVSELVSKVAYEYADAMLKARDAK